MIDIHFGSVDCDHKSPKHIRGIRLTGEKRCRKWIRILVICWKIAEFANFLEMIVALNVYILSIWLIKKCNNHKLEVIYVDSDKAL